VDSGGILNGLLLRAGLVNEVSVLIHPAFVGGTTPKSMFTAPDLKSSDDAIKLKLSHFEKLKKDIIWVRYKVVNK
jgi:2,5-diamino-6-(ribosylamino)-4(3H)-pyrimidinone 5'-phosphate reductase